MALPTEPSPAIDRDRVVALLRARAHDLHARGVKRLALFGSVARNEAHAASDVDLLVELDPDAGVGFGVVSLKRDLDLLLGRPVGLTFASRLRPSFKARIERDLVPVF